MRSLLFLFILIVVCEARFGRVFASTRADTRLELLRRSPGEVSATPAIRQRLSMYVGGLRTESVKTVRAFMKQFAPRSVIKAQPRVKRYFLKSRLGSELAAATPENNSDGYVPLDKRLETGRKRFHALTKAFVERIESSKTELEPRLQRGDDEGLLQSACRTTGAKMPWNAPKFVWTSAWAFHKFMLTHVLHRFDPCAPKDHCVNLSVLWWKAITGNKKGSVTDDQGLAYDLLPDLTRMVVSWPWAWFYPNLHSQNVAIRTLYLNKLIDEELQLYKKLYGDTVQVVTLGAGFDTRSVALAAKDASGCLSCAEIDLPSVVAQKKKMLDTFLLRRRAHLQNRLPLLIGQDLNDVDAVVRRLGELPGPPQPTIFVMEAVCMYLDDNKVEDLLQGCVGAAMLHGAPAVSVCFADRFPAVAGRKAGTMERDATKQMFRSIGMELHDYQGKPGRARSMGLARAQSLV